MKKTPRDKLLAFLTTNGRIKRGALARAAEHLGVSKISVRRWMDGSFIVPKGRHASISAMIADKLCLAPRKPPGRPRKITAN